MSSVYNSEPPTNGRVVIKTTIGDVDVELWPKEAPKACRNFLQLCTEGYYDGCTFFRLIKDLFAQTGDPTNTGNGGESVYGANFADEFHSRLRFTHRGILAMAGSGTKDSNGSQFFVTLAACEWLNSKHTIFGKITGDTIYNVLTMNELEVENDAPVYPPRIISTAIEHSPFDDIVPRANIKKLAGGEKKKNKKKENKKLKRKNTKLLSFGEEAEEEEIELASSDVQSGMASSHDVLEDDETLLKEAASEVVHSKLREGNEAGEREEQRKREQRQRLKDAVSSHSGRGRGSSSSDDDDGDDGSDDNDDDGDSEKQKLAGGRPLLLEGDSLSFDENMRQKLLEKQQQARQAGRDAAPAPGGAEATERAKIAELKAKMGYNKAGVGQKAARRSKASGDEKDGSKRRAEEAFMSPLEVMRQKYKRKKASATTRQKDTLSKLASFKSSLDILRGPPADGDDENGDEEEKMVATAQRTNALANLLAPEQGDEEAGNVDSLGVVHGNNTKNAKTIDGLDDLDSESSGAAWRMAAKSSLKFEKTLEERRAELRRDDNYKVEDSLLQGREDRVADIDMRKTQERRRLEGHRHNPRDKQGRRSGTERW